VIGNIIGAFLREPHAKQKDNEMSLAPLRLTLTGEIQIIYCPLLQYNLTELNTCLALGHCKPQVKIKEIKETPQYREHQSEPND